MTSRRTVIGGTFDRLHAGHKLLIETASKGTNHLEIWVTEDEMIRDKGPDIISYANRVGEIEDFVATLNTSCSLHRLVDEFGGAESRDDIDRIVCTAETRTTCDRINEHRVQHRLQSLDIVVVPHFIDESGEVLSSSRIRSGKVDREGGLWLPITETRLLGDDVMADLKQPFGKLFKGPSEDPSVAFIAATQDVANDGLVCVGDIVTQTAVLSGLLPKIGVIDGHTQRTQEGAQIDDLVAVFESVIHCRNPASTVTDELIEACQEALDRTESVLLIVDGEEDLTPIPLILLAPLGLVLIYGQPDQGIVQRRVDESSKSSARRIWNRMITEAGQ